jgi:hypothetical protein
MPRQLRIEYPGAIYHVMNRGDLREPILKFLVLTTLGSVGISPRILLILYPPQVSKAGSF